MSRVRCGCRECQYNDNNECQAEDVEFKNSRDDDGTGFSCDTFRRGRRVKP